MLTKAIMRVLDAHPDLSTYGWKFVSSAGWNDGDAFEWNRAKTTSRSFTYQVRKAVDYIEAEGLGKVGSYDLKHRVERWLADKGRPGYISNGAVIVAALVLGYGITRDENCPNCRFSARHRQAASPTQVQQGGPA